MGDGSNREAFGISPAFPEAGEAIVGSMSTQANVQAKLFFWMRKVVIKKLSDIWGGKWVWLEISFD